MSDFKVSGDFVDRVMEDVHFIHEKKQQKLLFAEKMVAALPVRVLLSLVAGACGLWNIIRIYQVVVLPAICR